MQNHISDDLISFSNMLMLTQDRGEFIKLAGELNGIICKALDMEKAGAYVPPQEKKKTLSATIKFTKEEIDMMSKTFKKEFIANGCVSHIIKRPSGKKGVYYEIRYRRNGYNISVSNTDIKTAKKLFIERTKSLDNPELLIQNRTKFSNIIEEWLSYKKGKVTAHSLQQQESRVKRFIPEDLKNKQIKDIRTCDVDKIINSADSPRKYEELRSLFNQIFKYAIASGIITHNPVTLVPFKRAERKTRDALTTEQILAFLSRIKQPKYDAIRQQAYLLYFFGLRPCEIDKELRFENGFLICRNRKRKGGKIEYKKIPVPKQAQGIIQFDTPLKIIRYNPFLELLKEALGNKDDGTSLTPYNLRHTFASLCAESVKPDVLDVWMGDSPERLVGRVYVHYKDDFMRAQMDCVKFIV